MNPEITAEAIQKSLQRQSEFMREREDDDIHHTCPLCRTIISPSEIECPACGAER